jgi:uncharacterized protein (TIGR03067 family)
MHWQLLTTVLIVAAPAPADDKKKDEEKIQGNWTVVSLVHGGTGAPDEEVKKFKFTIKDDTITINDGKKDEKATFKLDATKKPKTIDITPDPKDKGEMVPGIYELKDDELKICFTKGGKGGRPSEFVSKAGSDYSLVILKREKKDK